MLVPEVVDVLGGFVEHLEAARERLVQEVNKPPRGRRSVFLVTYHIMCNSVLGVFWGKYN